MCVHRATLCNVVVFDFECKPKAERKTLPQLAREPHVLNIALCREVWQKFRVTPLSGSMHPWERLLFVVEAVANTLMASGTVFVFCRQGIHRAGSFCVFIHALQLMARCRGQGKPS
jgi:hypothetical protein